MSMNFQGYRRYNSVTITYVHNLLPFPNMALLLSVGLVGGGDWWGCLTVVIDGCFKQYIN